MNIMIEIRAGEGGDDAKLLVVEQASIYLRYAERNYLKAEILNEEPG